MAYQYDIFISYRRNPETLGWIKDHFVPLLSHRVEFEIKRSPKIFLDEQMEAGTSYPAALGAALGASRILIALWTGNYLSSVWCTEEFNQMLGREKQAKLRTVQRPHGLVFPVFIHDGQSFPASLQHIKPIQIQSCFNSRMAQKGELAETLAARLAEQAEAFARSIQSAPAWRKKWPLKAGARFSIRFRQHATPVQKRVPRFTQP